MDVARLNPSTTKFLDFYFDFLIKNKPCIFAKRITDDWKSRKEWTNSENDSQPNFNNIERLFNGNTKVSVTNCDKQIDYSNSSTFETTLSDYLNEISKTNSECLYLKDWHFQSQFSDYSAYDLPSFFQSDWLNEYWDFKKDSVEIDYKFVYIGVCDTWTPFHVDVFRSFSWSANICGRKLWYIVAPGGESNFSTSQNSLAPDIRKLESFTDSSSVFISLFQEAGEIIFIPSNWHHQVHNLESTISINHNWCNAANVNLVWNYLRSSLKSVQNEIIDLLPLMEDWLEHCQKILKADVGLNYEEFLHLLNFIRMKRQEKISLDIYEKTFRLLTNMERRNYYSNLCKCENFKTLCTSCEEFLSMYDYEISSQLINDVVHDEEFKRLSCYLDCLKLIEK